MRCELPYDRLVPTARQARQNYAHLDELAVSIADNGLLQNLVARELPDGTFEVVAGERRRRAIGLLLLPLEKQVEQYGKVLGNWIGGGAEKSGSESGGVPVFVIPATATEAAHAIENIQRDNLYPWEIGRHFIAWNDAGYNVEHIASIISKSDGYVRQHITIGRCLSPRVTGALERIGERDFMSQRDLLKICQLFDGIYQEPQHEKQVELFEKLLGRTKRGGPKNEESRSEKHRVFDRAKKLGHMAVPGHAKPYVRALFEYLFNPNPVQKPDFNWK